MQPINRRSFFVKGSVAAVGVAGASTVGITAVGLREPELDDDEVLAAPAAIIDVKDVATGEVEILVGEKSITFTDKALVARIVRASA